MILLTNSTILLTDSIIVLTDNIVLLTDGITVLTDSIVQDRAHPKLRSANEAHHAATFPATWRTQVFVPSVRLLVSSLSTAKRS